ncbi:hypothetical protein CES85_5846 (plasmid) [Ochrobactrum quorumnocens]|uniref:Uncharacterized protein n=1 Tax=Ochrobactrum quorumnocens TaxID=271865 RepID=A0A248U9G7_9HYPH|nr:hypothetical protein CES85_5846 [[Ochrobactrum] quorumnocens]
MRRKVSPIEAILGLRRKTPDCRLETSPTDSADRLISFLSGTGDLRLHARQQNTIPSI